jgi:hypothetical protein
VLGPVILIGLGIGMSFVPMTLSATAGVPPHEAGLASGFINTTRQVGGALGLAVMATIATTIATDHAPRGIGPDCRLSGGVRHRRVRSGDRCPLGSRPAEIVSRYRESAHGGSRRGLEEAGEPQVAFEG